MPVTKGERLSLATRRNHFLGIEELELAELFRILETAKVFLENQPPTSDSKYPTLRGTTVMLLFAQSTSLTVAFERAAQRLSADVITPGLSLFGTSPLHPLGGVIRDIAMLAPHVLVLQHPVPGSSRYLASIQPAQVINAGDGWHENPVVALAEILCMSDSAGGLQSLAENGVSLMNVPSNSALVKSNTIGLRRLGVPVTIHCTDREDASAYKTLGCETTADLKAALTAAQVVKPFFPDGPDGKPERWRVPQAALRSKIVSILEGLDGHLIGGPSRILLDHLPAAATARLGRAGVRAVPPLPALIPIGMSLLYHIVFRPDEVPR